MQGLQFKAKIAPYLNACYDKKLLLLHGNDSDPQFHKSLWYVVTGSKEIEDGNLKDTIKREVKEVEPRYLQKKDSSSCSKYIIIYI